MTTNNSEISSQAAPSNGQAGHVREAEPIDAAVAHARASIAPRSGGVRTAAIVVAVGAGAFFAGHLWSSRGERAWSVAPSTSTSSPTGGETGETEKQLWTCSMHPQVIQDHPGICPICHMELTPLKSGTSGSDSGAVTIDPVVVQNMGVRTAQVTRGPLVQSVRVVGYLEEPEPLHRDVNLRVGGWIEKLHANIDGMVITKGMPLFELYSPELVIAIDELIAARKQAEQSPSDASAQAMLETSRRKLAQLGLEQAQIVELAKGDTAPSSVPILSPLDGHLTSKMVYEGAAVKAGDLVLRLASRQRMWIDAQVHEQQMSLISDGQPVRASVVSQPGRTYTGKVLFIHPHVDPQTRTALVRIEIENADMTLRQGMYATVEILADAYREASLVPREAVIDTGRRQIVFVALGEGRFSPREVELGLSGENDTVEVLSGLQQNDAVVTSGQFLLDSESRLKEAVAKHLSAGLPRHAGHGAHAAATGTDTTAPQDDASVRPSRAATQPAELLTVPHADDVLRAYLDVQKKLGARQETGEPADVAALVQSASVAAEHATAADAKAIAGRVAEAARSMSGKTLTEQRKAFVPLSEAVIDLARRARLSNPPADTLYVMHCPMAFDDVGANWLQAEETLANPYYATQMKRCGEIVDRVPVKK